MAALKTKPKHRIKMDKKAVLLFQLGTLQVFYYQNDQERLMHMPYDMCHWQDTALQVKHGPFVTLFDAMNDYANYMKAMKVVGEESTVLKPLQNVVFVDFRTKRRIS